MQVKFLVTARLLHSLRIVLIPLAEGEKEVRKEECRYLRSEGKDFTHACTHAHTTST